MPRKTDSSSAADWLEIAEADLTMVRLVAERELSFSPCRAKLAEALEKLLKPELIRLEWNLERTHDLQKLAKLLRERESDLVDSVQPLVSALSEAYFSDRYPGFDVDDPDWPSLIQQINAVERLVLQIRLRLKASEDS